MGGGLIHVAGNAGERAADKMRRGFILIEGGAGTYAGSRMLAGTLAIGGRAGALPGYLMNRGTILLAGGVDEMSPTFVDCGVFALVAARLIAVHVAPTSARLGAAFRTPLRRFAGDLGALGNGEIRVAASEPRPTTANPALASVVRAAVGSAQREEQAP
jgi:formylmethanofuran dehydrogenase subunit C